MGLRFAGLMTGVVVVMGLAGCQLDPALMGETPAAQPAAPPVLNDPAHYGPVVDSGLNVPAIPVEQVPPAFQRQIVAYDTDQPPGTIIIDPSTKHLYLVAANKKAMRYGISVGRAGFGWSGVADITRRTTWPKWTPPYEMIDRNPDLEKFRDVGQPGGLTNPLGARALYLTTNGVDYGYRIHGTPEWNSIGRNASSGCIRMINQDVMDLYNRVPDGTRVVVLTEDGQFPTRLTVPPVPAPKKPAPPAPPPPAPLPPTPPETGVGPF
jgi:lipoprotein-anchoring transpeptidase ErfK/SrfK